MINREWWGVGVDYSGGGREQKEQVFRKINIEEILRQATTKHCASSSEDPILVLQENIELIIKDVAKELRTKLKDELKTQLNKSSKNAQKSNSKFQVASLEASFLDINSFKDGLESRICNIPKYIYV